MVLARALDVRIFNTQQHFAAVMAGVELIEDRRSRSPHVQVTGWRRGESELPGCDTLQSKLIMRKSRGFSLIEVLVGLLLLTIVLTTTISMLRCRPTRTAFG